MRGISVLWFVFSLFVAVFAQIEEISILPDSSEFVTYLDSTILFSAVAIDSYGDTFAIAPHWELAAATGGGQDTFFGFFGVIDSSGLFTAMDNDCGYVIAQYEGFVDTAKVAVIPVDDEIRNWYNSLDNYLDSRIDYFYSIVPPYVPEEFGVVPLFWWMWRSNINQLLSWYDELDLDFITINFPRYQYLSDTISRNNIEYIIEQIHDSSMELALTNVSAAFSDDQWISRDDTITWEQYCDTVIFWLRKFTEFSPDYIIVASEPRGAADTSRPEHINFTEEITESMWIELIPALCETVKAIDPTIKTGALFCRSWTYDMNIFKGIRDVDCIDVLGVTWYGISDYDFEKIDSMKEVAHLNGKEFWIGENWTQPFSPADPGGPPYGSPYMKFLDAKYIKTAILFTQASSIDKYCAFPFYFFFSYEGVGVPCTLDQRSPAFYQYQNLIQEIRDFLYVFDDDKSPDLPNEMYLLAYPNPFNSSCVIEAPAGADVEIYDLRGNVVYKTPLLEVSLVMREQPFMSFLRSSGESGSDEVEGEKGYFVWVPTTDVPSGIYLVRAKTENGTTATEKIVYLK